MDDGKTLIDLEKKLTCHKIHHKASIGSPPTNWVFLTQFGGLNLGAIEEWDEKVKTIKS